MRVSHPGLTVRPYGPQDEPAVLDLLSAALAGGPTGARTADFFRWKHAENPFGRSLMLVAEFEEQVVGLRAFLRWRFTAGGRTYPAVRAVDTATRPDHQGKGIFTTLTLAALEEAASTADFVFNTPNDRSLPGYLRMGWETVGRLPIAVRPVRPLRFARGARHATRGAPSGPAPPCPHPPAADVLDDRGVGDLLGESELEGLHTDRSLDYLRWRYAAAPGLDYRGIALFVGNELTGAAFGRLRRRGPLAEFTLGDIIVRRGDSTSLRRLLAAAARSGCDHVATCLTRATPLARAGWRRGYLGLPGLGITLVTRPLHATPLDPRRAGSWQLSLGDLEVF